MRQQREGPLPETPVERAKRRQSEARKQGLISDKPVRIGWKVDPHRRDKRTGPLSFRPMSDYAAQQYEDMMRKWP